MKRAKHLLALAITAILAIAMATPAFAASITINSGADSGDKAETTTYTYYEIFKADIATAGTVDPATGGLTEEGVAAYYIPAANADLATLVNATSVFKTTLSADGSRYIVELEGTPNGAAIAAALNTADIKAKALATSTFAQTTPAGTATASNLDPGYYLITSDLGTVLAVQTLSDVTINEKNDYPSVTKTVAETSNSAQIGDDVVFTIALTIPATANKEIVVHDTMSDGLTFKNAVVNGADATDATVSDDGKTITFSEAFVSTLTTNKTVTITYTAELNTSAEINTSADNADKNTNSVYLTYSNFTSKTTTVGMDTQEIELTKYDGADTSKKPIAGAKFELRANGTAIKLSGSGTSFKVDPRGTVTQITTVANTPITVDGLDADVTYTWVEIDPPTGYNGLTEGVDVKPVANKVVKSEVANNKGATLPSTGGMGTTLIYAVGAILVIGSGIGFVARRKMNA